jgi:DNA modification methylase
MANNNHSNQLYYGDNIDVLRKYIKEDTIDLCYIDPPFNSKRNYNQIYNNIGKEDRAQAQAFIDTWTWDTEAQRSFDQIIENDNGRFTKQCIHIISGLEKVLSKGDLLAYLVSLTLRITEIYRVLKPTGSFYLHCDSTASHYIKLICDAIFCSRTGIYQSEIVWRRTTAHGNAKQGARKFEVNFDTIFFYTKSTQYDFTPLYEPFKPDQVDQQYSKVDENGRRYRLVTPTAARGGGDTSYEFHGVKPPKGRFWAYSKENMNKFYDDGKLYFSSTGQPYIIYYLDERPGVGVMSFWDDIKPMSPTSKERLGYPTQKPEALLERIIKASSKEGGIVLDAYCGCGTTVAVAQRLHRNWIGIDITYQSISLIIKRLSDVFGEKILDGINLNGIPKDFEAAVALANKKNDKTRKEFEKWVVLTYSKNRAAINEKKAGDGGIDGTAFILDLDDSGTQTTLEVIFSVKSDKKLSPDVVRDLNGTVERQKAAFGILITLYSRDNLIKESKKYGHYHNRLFDTEYARIPVISVADILNGKCLNLPSSIAVLRKASKKPAEKNQPEIEFNS